MASVKLVLDKRSIRKDGAFSVKLYVSHKGKDFFIATSVKVMPEIWIDDKLPGYNPQAPTTDKLYFKTEVNPSNSTNISS